MKKYDVIVIGAGAAGLTAARAALARGRNVAIFDMGTTPARKVMASGGGRCNITNAAATYDRYFGKNPDFVRSALARVRPGDILDWATQNNIGITEKAAGQYFCTNGAGAVVDALIRDVRGADIYTDTPVTAVTKPADTFVINTKRGDFGAPSLVIATGGVSFPTLGVSDFGFRVAKQFGHRIVPPRPALCAIVTGAVPSEMAGIALPVEIDVDGEKIVDSMLVTHHGLGGPAIYRATVRNANEFHINMLPGVDVAQWLREQKRTSGRRSLGNVLGAKLPTRIATWIAGDLRDKNIADIRDVDIVQMGRRISDFHITEFKYHGMAAAEITRGGVDTHDVSSKTMESKIVTGLFFAGEVLDIAGDLGGFNLHWAWASGRIAGENA